MSRVAFDFGFIQIYWYSIFIFFALLFACGVIYREARRRNVDEDMLVNLTFTTVVASIIGARLYYVLFNLPYYMHHPVEIFEIWNGGLAIHGGIICGLIAVIVFCNKRKENVMRLLDMIVVGLILGQAIGRWGNFFNSEAYGAITTLESLKFLPDFIVKGMYILGEYRQPTFLYESIGCLIGFVALLVVRMKSTLKRGTLTSIYLIWYGVLRFIIEGMRSDSLMLGSLKVAQLVSAVMVIVGLVIFILNLRKSDNPVNLYRKDPKELAMEQLI